MPQTDLPQVDHQERAKAVHDVSIIIDTHCDTLGRVIEGRRRLGDRSTDDQFDLPRAIEGGLTAEVMATFVSEARHGDGIRLLDVSHLSPARVDDVLARTDKPVVATHASTAAEHPQPRNLDDRRLEAIVATGGVVGVVPVPAFFGPLDAVAPLEPLTRRLDHIIGVVGDEDVGLGLDFDGVGTLRTNGIEIVADLRILTNAVVARGYGFDRIRNVLGGNFLQVFDEVLGHGA